MNGFLCSNCAIDQLSNPDIKSDFTLHSLKNLQLKLSFVLFS